MTYFSISSELIVDEAKRMGLEVDILKENKNFFVIKGNNKEVIFKSTDFGYNSSLGYKIADDKELTNIILERNGLKIPKSVYIKKDEISNLSELILGLDYPLVTKPVDEGHGNGVTVGIENEEELMYGINEALKFEDNVIVQELIEGDEHRILVIGDEVVLGYKRIPAFVIGDGVNAIKKLIEKENTNPLRGDGYEKEWCLIKIDDRMINYLSKYGLTIDNIPEKNKHIRLRGISNIGAGGVPVDVTQEIGEELKKQCVQAAKNIGLKIAGVDVITNDLSKSLEKSKGAIIEVNATPGFGGLFQLTGINVGQKILKYVFDL